MSSGRLVPSVPVLSLSSLLPPLLPRLLSVDHELDMSMGAWKSLEIEMRISTLYGLILVLKKREAFDNYRGEKTF